MSLTLHLNTSENCTCKTLTLTDATGVYHATDNPTGWGAPNPAYSDITCAYLKITIPSGDVYYKDVTSIFTGATSLSDLVFTIDGGDIGETSNNLLSDGVYVVEYHVNDDGTFSTNECTGGTEYRSTINIPLFCQVQKCIIAKMVKVPQHYCCDECGNKYIDYIDDLWIMLKALQTADVSVSVTHFENVLEQVQKLCNNEDCECV